MGRRTSGCSALYSASLIEMRSSRSACSGMLAHTPRVALSSGASTRVAILSATPRAALSTSMPTVRRDHHSPPLPLPPPTPTSSVDWTYAAASPVVWLMEPMAPAKTAGAPEGFDSTGASAAVAAPASRNARRIATRPPAYISFRAGCMSESRSSSRGCSSSSGNAVESSLPAPAEGRRTATHRPCSSCSVKAVSKGAVEHARRDEARRRRHSC